MKTTLPILILTLLLTTFATADQSSSYSSTEGFYHWYIKASDNYRDNFDQAKPYFTEELHGLLSKGFKNGPDDGFWIDFDPFINAQMSAGKVSVGKPYTAGNNLDMVKVTPIFTRGNFEGSPAKVYVVKQGENWVIANIVHTGDNPLNLKDYLKQGLGILSSGNDTGFVGEDPSTMLSTEEMLLGKWKHISSSPTIDGTRRPMGDIDITWTFRADGTGQFYQKVSPGAKAMVNDDMRWTLDGDTITLGTKTKYTMVKKGEASMTWRNHLTNEFFFVEKR